MSEQNAPENGQEVVKVPTPPKRFTAEHGREVGLPSPDAVNYMMSVAQHLVGSALCTPDMLKFNGPAELAKELGLKEIIKANAMAKMLAGFELGIPAIESLRTIHVVKGKIFVAYEKLISVMQARGYVTTWIKADRDGAQLKVWHPDGRLGKDGYVAEFDMDKAKQAGLLKSYDSGEPNQYEKRPDVMFRARCASDAYRVCGAGPTLYSFEEEEEVSRDGEHRAAPEKPEGKYNVTLKSEVSTPALEPPKPEPPKTESNVGQASGYFRVAVVDGEKRIDSGDQKYDMANAAKARALELMAATGKPHAVMELNGHEIREIARYDPPQKETAPEPPPPSPEAPQRSEKALSGDATEAPKVDMTPVQKRMVALSKQVATTAEAMKGKIGEKDCLARVVSFLCGYVGVKTKKELPRKPDLYTAPLDDLEVLVYRDVNEVLAEPTQAGKRKADQEADFTKLLEYTKWPEDTWSLFRRFARVRDFDGESGEKFIKGMELDIGPASDAHAYVRLLLRAFPDPKPSSERQLLVAQKTGKLFKACRANNLSMAKAIEQIESARGVNCPLEQAELAALESALDGFIKTIAEAAKTPKPAPAPKPPEPPAKQEEEQGGLFDD